MTVEQAKRLVDQFMEQHDYRNAVSEDPNCWGPLRAISAENNDPGKIMDNLWKIRMSLWGYNDYIGSGKHNRWF